MDRGTIYDLILTLSIFMCLGMIFWLYYQTKRNSKFVSFLIDKQNNELDNFKDQIIMAFDKSSNDIISAIEQGVTLDSIRDHKGHIFEIFSKLKSIIGDDLHSVLKKTKACRTAIYLFHNGIKTPNGFSFIKMSCVADKVLVGSGITEKIINQTNMPVNIFDDMYNELLENGKFTIMNTPEVMQTSQSQFLSSSKIRYSQAVCIYDSTNILLGFILGEYDHPWDVEQASEEYDKICSLCKKLSPLFSYTGYANLTLSDDSTNND